MSNPTEEKTQEASLSTNGLVPLRGDPAAMKSKASELAVSSPSPTSSGIQKRMAGSAPQSKEPSLMQSADTNMNDRYNIGIAAVDIRGKLILDTSKTGGWRAALFIFGNETAERMAYFGIILNLVFYLVYSIHISFPDSSTLVTNFVGTTNITPLLGAFLADSYLGRYWTIGLFSTIYLVGLILLALSASLPGCKPSAFMCNDMNLFMGKCEKATSSQMAFLYVSLYTIALGSGGIKPCVSTFGADQFDPEDPKEKLQLGGYFNVFYFTVSTGVVLSLTLVVYISDYISWGWGFGTLAIAMALSNIMFFIGTPYYRHKLPSGSPLTRLTQVLVASFRNWRVEVPSDAGLLYEVYDKESAIVGSRKLPHSETLRFFDKAAVETIGQKGFGDKVSGWRLCTVTQVEELKALAHVFPIWATSIPLNTVFLQLLNFGSQQGVTMNRRIGSLTVPAASVGVVGSVFILFALPFYDKVMVPCIRRFTGNPRGITFLQRIGAGLVISIAAVVAAALVEQKRRRIAWDTNTVSSSAVVPMAASWLVLQYTLVGLGEIFATIGQLEFFYDQAPDSMRSIGTALFATTTAFGGYFGSVLVSVVKKLTERNGKTPWIADEISKGHMDYYYWLLAVISGLNFICYLYLAHRYKYKVPVESTMRETRNKALTKESELMASEGLSTI